jgi:hypothetical protein
VRPAEAGRQRPGGSRRAGSVRLHQDDHHTGSIFQKAPLRPHL